MEKLLANGRFIDLALVVVVLEAAFLVARRRLNPRGLKPLDIGGHLLAGALLLLALRCALVAADYRWTLLLLSASFPAHIFDLVRRARHAAAG